MNCEICGNPAVSQFCAECAEEINAQRVRMGLPPLPQTQTVAGLSAEVAQEFIRKAEGKPASTPAVRSVPGTQYDVLGEIEALMDQVGHPGRSDLRAAVEKVAAARPSKLRRYVVELAAVAAKWADSLPLRVAEEQSESDLPGIPSADELEWMMSDPANL